MKSEDKKIVHTYFLIMDKLAEEALDLNEDELNDILIQAKKNPEDISKNIRDLFSDAFVKSKKYKLEKAKKDFVYDQENEKIRITSFKAKSRNEKIELLLQALKLFPDSSLDLTFQNRELKELTEEDLNSAFEDFYELGIFDQICDKKSK